MTVFALMFALMSMLLFTGEGEGFGVGDFEGFGVGDFRFAFAFELKLKLEKELSRVFDPGKIFAFVFALKFELPFAFAAGAVLP
jgi:hypothetical protein